MKEAVHMCSLFFLFLIISFMACYMPHASQLPASASQNRRYTII
jgi:hypothetical protein